MPVVIFRYDDYHADRGAQDASKSQIERRLLDIFSRHNVPLTMGVVPNVVEDYVGTFQPANLSTCQRANLPTFQLVNDREKLTALKAAIARGVVEPALHGWQHQNVNTLACWQVDKLERANVPTFQRSNVPTFQPANVPTSQRNSEFVGLQFEEQLRKIEQGKRALEEWLETPVVSFIPPWNTYDEQTVRALDAVHIRALSASLSTAPNGSGLSPCQGEATALVCLPRTCALAEFDDALTEVKNVGRLAGWNVGRLERWQVKRSNVPTFQRSNVPTCQPGNVPTFQRSNLPTCQPDVAVIVMMFHHFSFFESDDPLARQYANVSLEQLESLVARCARDETIETLTIGEAARRYRDQLSDGRFAAAVQYDACLRRLSHKRYIGKHLARRFPHRAFYPVEFYRKRLKWLQALAR
ncbi:MAG: DUF2334 domain-containing protein [Abditibacteriales bacterium]|nr:DUF2334 domain-containing protein [Abditibacteriales bacterium]MDW8366966.1 DUF2334 domain-containing protein [Abditibacteriales bacterium]